MARSIKIKYLIILALAVFAGCRERRPSGDIFEAINRKDYRESEIRDFVLADPTLVSARDDINDTILGMNI